MKLPRRRLRSVMLVFAVAGPLVGCGGQSESDYVPPADAARSALAFALDQWQAGQPAEPDLAGTATTGGPQVKILDQDWREGRRLVRYEVLREVPAAQGEPRQFEVQLVYAEGGGPLVANYFVVGIDPLWVFRDKDYAKTSGM